MKTKFNFTEEELVEKDPLLPAAIDLAVSTQNISATTIRRAFKIAYPRAARIMDLMLDRGIISREDENAIKYRVEMTEEEFKNIFGELGKHKTPVEENIERLNFDKIKFFDLQNNEISNKKDEFIEILKQSIASEYGLICLDCEDLEKILLEKDYKLQAVSLSMEDLEKSTKLDIPKEATTLLLLNIAQEEYGLKEIVEIINKLKLDNCNLIFSVQVNDEHSAPKITVMF